VVLKGRHRIVLEHDHVHFVPRRMLRRAAGVVVPYRDIAVLRTVDRRPGERGAFVVRLYDGREIRTSFPKRATLRMRSVHHHARKRVRAARRHSHGGASSSLR
jgi:hypothetical protein